MEFRSGGKSNGSIYFQECGYDPYESIAEAFILYRATALSDIIPNMADVCCQRLANTETVLGDKRPDTR
jgi:hypothetical protein